MRIIHLYPPHIPELAQYVFLLTELPGVEMEATDDVKTFLQMCEGKKPDIVHLHGCQHADYNKVALQAQQQGARIVITPHGQLEPWEMDQRIIKSLRLKGLVNHAYSLIARSPIEHQELKELDWNNRIEIIRNPILTRTTNKETCLELHRKVYQKVMDSYVLEMMDETTTNVLRTLLKVGITEDSRWGSPVEESLVNWHYLLIYAEQEGILPLIEKGCQIMGIKLSETTAAPSYLPSKYDTPTPLAGKPILEMVIDIKRHVDKGTLSLLSLAELDKALRNDDVEDDVLMQQIETEELSNFFAALMTVMNEQTGLDEGFMPCTPTDNKETKKIRTTIKKHLQI